MQLHCPHCEARLAARLHPHGEAKCLACGQHFPLKDARVPDPAIRALTAPQSLRTQLDKIAGNGGRKKAEDRDA